MLNKREVTAFGKY